MDRGAWWATVHRLAESAMTEATRQACTLVQIWLLTHIPAYGLLRILEKSCSKPKLTYGACVKESTCQAGGQGDPLEKDMATHSSIPAWEIPWTEAPSGLQSLGSQRVGRDLAP